MKRQDPKQAYLPIEQFPAKFTQPVTVGGASGVFGRGFWMQVLIQGCPVVQLLLGNVHVPVGPAEVAGIGKI